MVRPSDQLFPPIEKNVQEANVPNCFPDIQRGAVIFDVGMSFCPQSVRLGGVCALSESYS